MHYVGHLSVNKLNAIKPLPVRKLNMKCLHILQKLKTLMNFKYSCSKAIIFRMFINHIVWELDSLCFLLRNIVHISAWQSWAIYFPLYFIFVHAVQFPCLNPSCMDKETNSVLSLGLLHILLLVLFFVRFEFILAFNLLKSAGIVKTMALFKSLTCPTNQCRLGL